MENEFKEWANALQKVAENTQKMERLAIALEKLAATMETMYMEGLVTLPDTPASDN